MARRTKFTDFEPMKQELLALREENARLKAEVARLEGLILRGWDDADAAAYVDLEAEARRIRTQREEGGLYHSHTCDLHPEDQCQACEEGR